MIRPALSRRIALTVGLLSGCGPLDAFEISVAVNPYNSLSRVVTVETQHEDVSIAIQHEMGTTPSQGPGEIYVQGLSPGKTHTLAVLADDEVVAKVEVEIEPLVDDWTTCEPTTPAEVTEEIVCTAVLMADEVGGYMCFDRAGTPVWMLEHPTGERISLLTPMPNGGYVGVSWSRAVLSAFTERGEWLSDYGSSWFEERTRFQHDWIDMHEVIVIEEGRWEGAIAVLTKTADLVGEKTVYAGGVIVLDPESFEVLWDWQVHGVLGDEQPIDSKLSYHRSGVLPLEDDWDHTNALVHRVREDGTEEIWLSMRTQDWIIAVDTDTDEVLWRLGGQGDFAGERSDWFYQQHAPEIRVENDVLTMLVFDNSWHRPDMESSESRVLELAVDDEAMVVTRTAEVVNGFYSEISGDVDLAADGQSLIYVVGAPDDPDQPHIAEVSWPDGEPVWKLECDVRYLYRAELFPSVYERRPLEQATR